MEAYELKDSGIDWLGDIPNHWRFRKVKRDFDVLLGKMIQPEQRREHDKEYSYLRAANIDWAGVKTNDVKTMWFQPFEVKKYALKYGDLLVSEGGDVGKSSLWSNELKNCFFQNAINRVRAKQLNDTRFLYYWICFLKHIGYVDSIVNRITIAHLTAEKLEALPILICSPVEQKAIAEYLDKACQNIDKTISLKQQQLEKLEAYRKSVIHEAVTKGLDKMVTMKKSGIEWLGDIPKKWKLTKAKYVSEIFIPQRNKPVTNSELGCCWVTMENMKNPIIVETNKFISKESQKNAASKTLPKLSVIASCIGSFGIASVNTVEVIINQQLQAYIPRVINPYYFRYLVTISKLYFDRVATKTTLTYVNGEKFASLPVLIPTTEEQQKIVDYLDKACANIDKTKENLSQQIKTLTQYRQSLIHECVTGKKRVYQSNK